MHATIRTPWHDDDSSKEIDLDELNSYNAAFHELGFRWHWDAATYAGLVGEESDASARLHRYIGDHHPHLLRAYDAEFLVAAIEQRRQQVAARAPSGANASGYFNWAASAAGELGA